ncbi:hypothetical protein HDU76_013870 [Blyttiomyces sp. JEL0837]|nr:hypothetical protein HDU76_013870 [Blyttiomyces sp. JEL0837]
MSYFSSYRRSSYDDDLDRYYEDRRWGNQLAMMTTAMVVAKGGRPKNTDLMAIMAFMSGQDNLGMMALIVGLMEEERKQRVDAMLLLEGLAEDAETLEGCDDEGFEDDGDEDIEEDFENGVEEDLAGDFDEDEQMDEQVDEDVPKKDFEESESDWHATPTRPRPAATRPTVRPNANPIASTAWEV